MGSEPRTCLTCKWCKQQGPHLGCYYNGEWQTWLKKETGTVIRCLHRPGHFP